MMIERENILWEIYFRYVVEFIDNKVATKKQGGRSQRPTIYITGASKWISVKTPNDDRKAYHIAHMHSILQGNIYDRRNV